MAKRDFGVAKWRQNQFQNSNENQFVSQRAETREMKQRIKQLRSFIVDKVWFDSLSFTDQEQVFNDWFYFYNPNGWSTDPDMEVMEGESKEDYCKRRTPGCKYTQRDIKLNKILN